MRILVVDDEIAQAESLAQLLKAHKHETMSATTVKGAEILATLHPPDAVVLDVILSGENGLSFLGWLRGREETREIPVVVTTALPRDLAPPLPPDPKVSFLQKPFDYEELVTALTKLSPTGGKLG